MNTIAPVVICLGTKGNECVQDFVYLEQNTREKAQPSCGTISRIPGPIQHEPPVGCSRSVALEVVVSN